MQETSALPAYVKPEVLSFTEEEVLEELGAIQAYDIGLLNVSPLPVSPSMP